MARELTPLSIPISRYLEGNVIKKDETLALEVYPTGCETGAEIKGADITKPLATDDVEAIKQALVDHQGLLFRDQPLTDR